MTKPVPDALDHYNRVAEQMNRESCEASELRERIVHLEAQLRDAEITLAKREARLDEAGRLEMQRAREIEDAEQKGWNEAIEAAAKLFEANFPIGGRGGFAIRALALGPVQGRAAVRTEDILERNKPESWASATIARDILVMELMRWLYPEKVKEAEELADSICGPVRGEDIREENRQ